MVRNEASIITPARPPIVLQLSRMHTRVAYMLTHAASHPPV